VDQIRRASVSIMSNIAEGFERGTNNEFIQFLFIAKGSCGEVRTQLTIAFDQKYIEESTYTNLVEQCRCISGMINNLIEYLKRSIFKGSKFKRPPAKNISEGTNEILAGIKNQKNEK
jgi:four helix bundle protein